MPPAPDWRSAITADKLMQLEQDQFAVEFLRRNPEYRKDYQDTQDRIASGDVPHANAMEELARRWGLSFPACPGRTCLGDASNVEAGALPGRNSGCCGA